MSDPKLPPSGARPEIQGTSLTGLQAPRLAPWAEEQAAAKEDENFQLQTLKKDMLMIFMLSFSVVGGIYFLPLLVPQRTMGSNSSSHRGPNGRPLLMELRNCRVVSPAVDPVAVSTGSRKG